MRRQNILNSLAPALHENKRSAAENSEKVVPLLQTLSGKECDSGLFNLPSRWCFLVFSL